MLQPTLTGSAAFSRLQSPARHHFSIARSQWHSTLATYAYPILGDRPVAEDATLVLSSLVIQHDIIVTRHA